MFVHNQIKFWAPLFNYLIDYLFIIIIIIIIIIKCFLTEFFLYWVIGTENEQQ